MGRHDAGDRDERAFVGFQMRLEFGEEEPVRDVDVQREQKRAGCGDGEAFVSALQGHFVDGEVNSVSHGRGLRMLYPEADELVP